MTKEKIFTEVLKITNAKLLEELCSVSELVKVKKGTFVVKEGEIQTYIAFLIDGVIRGFYESADGREVTECFGYGCGEPAMACHDLESPSAINLVAEKESTCIKVPIATIKRLLDRYTELVYVYNELLVKDLEKHLKIKQVLYKYDAMGRYQWFLEEYPGLIDIVSHKDIASFLGMTPVTLSRLRRYLRGGGVRYRRKQRRWNRYGYRAGGSNLLPFVV